MPRRGTIHSKGHQEDRLSDNVYRGSSAAVTLTCGHTTKKNPLATRANGAALYVCPECGGLLERKR